jgi:hypothetical protein
MLSNKYAALSRSRLGKSIAVKQREKAAKVKN